MATRPASVLAFRSAAVPDTAGPSGLSGEMSQAQSSDTAATDLTVPAPVTVGKSSQLLTIQDLGNGRSFVRPLYVSVEQAGDEWFATSADLALVGRGESDLDALDDLREQIAELYQSLVEMRETLGPHLVNQLAFLERLAGAR